MIRLAVAFSYAFLLGFTAMILVLVVSGCAKPPSDYWGSLARGLQQEQAK